MLCHVSLTWFGWAYYYDFHVNVLNHLFVANLTPLAIICSFAHICVSNKIEGVRIPCCAHYIQMQTSNLCTYLGDLPHFICITNLCSSYYFIYLSILIGLISIEGMRIPCLYILYSNTNSNLCTNLGELPHII